MAIIGFSSAYCDNILNKVFRNTDFTTPTAINLSLHTADPLETGGSEVTGGSYARQSVSFNPPASGTGTARKLATFITPAAVFSGMPACTITHFGLWTSTGGFIGGGALSTPRTLLAGDAYDVKTLEVSLD